MPSSELLGAMSEFRNNVSRTILAYFKLWDFLTLRIETVLGATLHQIADENEFWLRLARTVYGSENLRTITTDDEGRNVKHNNRSNLGTLAGFKHGDQVILRNFYVSDWIPRIPGELWKQELIGGGFGKLHGLHDFFDPDAHRYIKSRLRISQDVKNWIEAACARHPDGLGMAAGIPSYDWFGKIRITLAGIGSIRLPLNFADPDHFACLGAVTARSWLTDLGIPVVVSEQVYREFDRSRSNRNVAVEGDLRGKLMIGHIPDPFVHIPLIAEGAQVSRVESILRRSTGIPLAYIHVTSPLDCDFRMNSTHPKCHAWTLFKCVHNPEEETADLDIRRMLSGLGAYGLTFTSFQPDHVGDVDRAVQFLRSSPKWLNVMRLGRAQLSEHDKEFQTIAEEWRNTEVQLLTDFDGLVPRLTEAQFSFDRTQQGSRSNKFFESLKDEFRVFRLHVASLAGNVAIDRAEFFHDLAYEYVSHPDLVLSGFDAKLVCRNCKSELTLDPLPDYNGKAGFSYSRTDWSISVDTFIKKNGWCFSVGRCYCERCVAKNIRLNGLIDTDNELCTNLLVTASDITGYRGFPVDLPLLLNCAKCNAQLRLLSSETTFRSYLPKWAWLAAQVLINAQWTYQNDTLLCPSCGG